MNTGLDRFPLIALFVLVAWLWLACGAPAVPHVTPVLPAGSYYVGTRVQTRTGDCSWVDDKVGGYFNVDDHGDVQSPLPEFVSCHTHYEPFSATCEGLGAKATLTGSLYASSGIWSGVGSGVAVGNFAGCKGLGFDWWMVRAERP